MMPLVTRSVGAGESLVTDDGCRVWNKFPAQNESVFWENKFVDGFVEGKGKLTWVDKVSPPEVHERVWIAGKMNGFAVSAFPGRDEYKGR